MSPALAFPLDLRPWTFSLNFLWRSLSFSNSRSLSLARSDSPFIAARREAPAFWKAAAAFDREGDIGEDIVSWREGCGLSRRRSEEGASSPYSEAARVEPPRSCLARRSDREGLDGLGLEEDSATELGVVGLAGPRLIAKGCVCWFPPT